MNIFRKDCLQTSIYKMSTLCFEQNTGFGYEKFGSNTSPPIIRHPFVSRLIKNCEGLKSQFVNGTKAILDK